MGGAVSSGRDNDELVDNLMSGNYIRTQNVERVFRALDRADYMSAEARDQAYKDLAWRNGPLHLSAPCIYSEVMEALELKPGLSFLNIGSGTGYLSTLVGMIIGSAGISHGVETSPAVFEYANKKLSQFIENSIVVDEFDFCIPKYYTGNGLCLSPSHTYDRVYCGAGVVAKYETYFKQFIKVGGVLVMPLADQLVQLRRVSATHWTRRNLLNVSFAHLCEPAPRDRDQLLTLEEQCPSSLQLLSRAAIRGAMRAGCMRRDAELREPPAPAPPPPRQGPRRICIPYDATSDEEVSDAEWEDLIHFAEELNELHDLDEAGGAHEMNALLSLVLSMGQNRAAGSLRFEHEDERPGHAHQEPVEEREREEAPAAPADQDFIVFDLGVRAAMRRRGRTPRAAPPAPAGPAARPAPAGPDATPTPAGPDATPAPAGPDANPAPAGSDANPAPAGPDATPAPAGPDANPAPAGPAAPPADPAAPPADPAAPPAPAAAAAAVNGKPAPPAAATRKRLDLDAAGLESDDSSSSGGSRSDGEARARWWHPPRPRAPPRPRPRPLRVEYGRTFFTDPSSSEDDDSETEGKDSKRQKLDSGIGEGTASSGASPDKSDDKTSPARSRQDEDGDTDMPWAESEGESLSSGASSESDVLEWEAGPMVADVLVDSQGCTLPGPSRGQMSGCTRLSRSHAGRRARAGGAGAAAGGAGVRRERLSLAMKRGVRELPLPLELKKYVNYQRCCQF